MSIPLNNIVKINPGVLNVGNNGNNLFGLMLTKQDETNKALAANQTTTFTSIDQVSELFGEKSQEYTLANVYFSGFTNSDRVAEQLYIAPYYTGSVPASLIGGSLFGRLTLQELRDFNGELTVSIGSNSYGPKTIDLRRAKSFSDAASIMSVALFGSDNAVGSITYSSANRAIVITAEGSNDTKITVSGSLGDALRLTSADGIQVSSASNNNSLTKLLNTIRQTNLSFCSVFLSWTPTLEEREELAKWANSMKDDVCVIINEKLTEGQTIKDLSFAENVMDQYEGVVCVYNNLELCAFIAGYPAAWDLTKTDGRFTAAFRRNTLLTANVNDEKEALLLKEKGYNFYGLWASATSNFTFMYEGKISGQYIWLDSWFCQVWMRRQFQYYFVLTMLSKGQIPYNTDGKGILTTAIKPAIDQYLNFGAIRPGISLSDQQVQELKQAGLNQSQINNITAVGYYLRVDMASVTPQTRVKRGSPPIDFWYTDGQSVQQINMNSIEIQ
ncbi:DUF3383 family protein [Commensalibacter communis]|uniref:DUF3383 family protein n=1 Tax=Commensalibacter communis TaxID=2972786 RepID=UPI0022FF8CBA|nr:DUF3383 family protein [Commensalibacter communis]CAI3958947.1 unnamed protein product [Commensalibacter communis]CAI3959416.1 unnamed protein product [Commensalibacter communis]